MRLRREVGRLDTISELPVSSLAGVAFTLMWGTLGGLAGAAAGMVAGKQEFICIGCQLNDGRKFIATMRASVFSRWCKACPDAKKIDKKK